MEGTITNQIAQGSMTRMVIMLNENVEINVDCMSQDDFPFKISERVYLRMQNKDIVNLMR